MLWNLPFQIRFMILFVLIPLLDRLYRIMFGYRLIPRNIKHHLKKCAKFCYYYSWYILFKTIITVLLTNIIEYMGRFCYYEDYSYVWLFSLLGYFSVGYIISLIHLKSRYRVIKWLSVIGLVGGLILSIHTTYHLLCIHGTDYLYRDLIWQPLLGLSIIYRYRIEIAIRS